jgi:hypothetical protein
MRLTGFTTKTSMSAGSSRSNSSRRITPLAEGFRVEAPSEPVRDKTSYWSYWLLSFLSVGEDCKVSLPFLIFINI